MPAMSLLSDATTQRSDLQNLQQEFNVKGVNDESMNFAELQLFEQQQS